MVQKIINQTSTSNISTLRSTHTATLAELERYKLLVENVEDYAIFLLDTEGFVQTWNKGARINKGYEAEEIIGRHFSTFYLQEDIDAKKPERELVLARRLGRVEDEDWRVRKDGSKFWANVVITALKDDSGELVGFAKVTRDLSERKSNEDLLRNSNVLLLKQQKELKAMNISKDEFISLASHQLRTPATAVKQLLGMLTQGLFGDIDPDLLKVISRAYEANERQIRIVESLLKVAQLDSGKVVLRKMPVNLHDYLTDITDEYSRIIMSKDQMIELVIDRSAPQSAVLDADHIRMTVGNLLDNASKYSQEGSKIILKASCKDDILLINIIDTGVGISPADQQQLFEKFTRIPNELSDKVGGSGLGLYWVKRVVKMHGGDITVKSETTKGSTFTIRLTLEKTDA